MQKVKEIAVKSKNFMFKKRHPPVVPEDYPTDWKSIYIATLLSVLSMLQQNCVNPTIWPYMQRIVPTSTQAEYSVMISITHASNAAAAVIFGFVANHFGDTKGALIFAKFMMLIGSVVYFFIEVFTSARMFMFYLCELIFGISGGSGSVAQTQIAMASTEVDRPKAMGIVQTGGFAGLVLGPLLQIAFTGLGYPGIEFLFGTRLNLYTVPILVSIGVSIVGIILLIFFFDGKMRVRKKEAVFEKVQTISNITKNDSKELLTSSNDNEPTGAETVPFDLVAAIICILTNTIVGLMMMIFSTVTPPFAMMVFNWTSEDMILWQSIGMLIVGVSMLACIGGYVFFKLGQRISPRNGILFSLATFLVFFILTFPWPIFGHNIPYKHPRGSDASLYDSIQSCVRNTSADAELIGCSCDYTWCSYTPPINIVLYFVASALGLGIAIPIMNINLNTLYSKILGPIKQGTMQGFYGAANISIQIIAPLIISQVYAASGIIYIWIFIMGMIIVLAGIWIFFYPRMIPYKERQEKIEKGKAKNCIVNFRKGRISIVSGHI